MQVCTLNLLIVPKTALVSLKFPDYVIVHKNLILLVIASQFMTLGGSRIDCDVKFTKI